MLNSRYSGASLPLTIAATADCNFRCIYCYEKDSIKTSKISLANQDAIIEFIKNQVTSLSGLQITWYGGEPLLAFDVIEYLSPEFIKICQDNNILYSVSIVSNGYLLTPDKAKKLREFMVTNIQVTLDGPEEIHDKRRLLVGGQKTFKKIIDNLKDCVEYFNSVNIRVNTDSENTRFVNEVRNTLQENDILKDNVGVYLGYVEDYNNAMEMIRN